MFPTLKKYANPYLKKLFDNIENVKGEKRKTLDL